MDVTNGPVFLLLRAKSKRRKLIPDQYTDGAVTVQLRQLLFGHLKDAELLDANGELFRVVGASFRRVDFAAYRSAGVPLGVLAFVFGTLILSCFVRTAVQLEHVNSLNLKEAKDWVARIVNESPTTYPHLLHEDLITKIDKARSLKSLISRWYFD